MGSTQVLGFAEAVTEGQVSLAAAVHWNLTANHWPPLPGQLVGPVVEAIASCQAQEWDSRISLPEGMTLAGSATVSAGDLVEATHCWPFVESEA